MSERNENQIQMFPNDERFPLPRLGPKRRMSNHQSPCLATNCKGVGHVYLIHKSTASRTRLELALCEKHAARVWEMPLLNSVPEYIKALQRGR
jgi:hypothetical protein